MDKEQILARLSIIILTIFTILFSIFLVRLMDSYTYRGTPFIPILGFVFFLCFAWLWYITITNIPLQKTVIKVYKKISIIGIMLLKRKKETFRNVIIIYSGLIFYLLYSFFIKEVDFRIVSFFIFTSCSLLLYENLVNYRIKKGYYGNNEREAREIVAFILKNYHKIDFTDGGKRKPIFSEDDLKEIIGHEWVPQTVKDQ